MCVYNTLMSGVDSGLGLCVLVESANRLSAFLSAERDRRPVGVEACRRSPPRGRAEVTGEGAASTGDTGVIMGALTGRVLLSGADAMATGGTGRGTGGGCGGGIGVGTWWGTGS